MAGMREHRRRTPVRSPVLWRQLRFRGRKSVRFCIEHIDWDHPAHYECRCHLDDVPHQRTSFAQLSRDPERFSCCCVGGGYLTNGYVGVVVRTTDGGTTWTTTTLSTLSSFNAVAFTDTLTGTIAGLNGTILKTTDGGESWVESSGDLRGRFTDVAFVDGNTGIIVGSTVQTGSQGIILRTTDGGGHWVRQSETALPLSSIAFSDANTAIAAGGDYDQHLGQYNGTVYRTTNAGMRLDNHIDGHEHYVRRRRPHTRTGTGVLVGQDNATSAPSVFRTTNGGADWARVAVPGSGATPLRCSPGHESGVAGGERGRFLSSTDGVRPGSSGRVRFAAYSTM